MIWDMYTNQLLPLFASEGDAEDYVCIAVCDLQCLQVIQNNTLVIVLWILGHVSLRIRETFFAAAKLNGHFSKQKI